MIKRTAQRDEYLRRNELHARSYGVAANLAATIGRLEKLCSMPQWLLDMLLRAQTDAAIVSCEMAAHRDEIEWKDGD